VSSVGDHVITSEVASQVDHEGSTLEPSNVNRPDYQAICDRFGIKLHMGTPPEVGPMANQCCCYGCDEIVVGEYDDVECEAIGFFHELGHCVSGKEQCLPQYEHWPYDAYAEAVAWKLGLRFAADDGITFSDKALAYAREQLSTYFNDDRVPETSPAKYLPLALRTAGLKTCETLEEATADRLHHLGTDMGLLAEDPFWSANDFPSEVQARLKEAHYQWQAATKVALAFAKKEFD